MNTPKIRFKGFTDDWEQRKLGALMEDGIILEQSDGNHGELYPRSEEFVNEGIPYIAASSISSDGERIDFNLTKYLSMERAIQFRKGVAKNGDVLLAHNATVGPSVMLSMDYEFAILSTSLTLYRLDKEKMSPMFFLQAIRSGYFQKQLEVFMKQTTRSQVPILTQRNLQISYPINKVEQERIGEFLSNLDHLITLHQRKCDETKQLKKFMLQKMFPKNGEKNPKIRFEGFTDDWEQRKFGEITELKSASRVHKDEWTSNGVPFYRSSDVMAAINETENEKAFISEELYEKLSKVSGKLEEGDILVTGGGSVGNPYIVPDNKPLYTKDADLLWIKNKGKFHPYFLYEFFFSPTFRNYLGSISHVGTIAHYTITQLSDTPICLPSFEEQKKVGEYFQSLDNLITLHQRKCEKLKALKKFMLQNMFI